MIEKLLRKNIRELKPYESARSTHDGQNMILMDANESPYIEGGRLELNRYPDPLQRELRRAVAEDLGVKFENICLTNGSDDAIDLIQRIFCEPREDAVVITPPTFGMFTVAAKVNDLNIFNADLKEDFSLDVDKIKSSYKQQPKILFLCSPNNPTGNLFAEDEVEELIRSFPGVVVLDQAYIEFTGTRGLVSLVDKYSNLIVLQTFSKVRSAAGIRIGIVIASPLIVHYLDAVKMSYNVNSLSIDYALQILKRDDQQLKNKINEIEQEKAKLQDFFRSHPNIQRVYDSAANFFLISSDRADQIYNIALDQGILLRSFSGHPLLRNALRVSVGTPEENKSLIGAVKAL